MKIKYLLFLIVPAFAFASGGGDDVEVDFVERTINFLIFFGILYYLIEEHVKNFFGGRIAGIAKELESIQVKLKESQAEKNSAIKSVEDAKKLAKEIVNTAKGEAKLLAQKIESDTVVELQILERAHTERVEIEERKMIREVVSEIVDDIFEDKSVSLNRDDFVNLVLKRAA